MKTVTTTREFDDQGRMVKETIVELDQTHIGFVYGCTCSNGFHSYPHYCPIHGYVRPYSRPTVAWTARSSHPTIHTSPGTQGVLQNTDPARC